MFSRDLFIYPLKMLSAEQKSIVEKHLSKPQDVVVKTKEQM